MCRDQHSTVHVCRSTCDFASHLGHDLDIQPRERLVEQQHARSCGQRSTNCHTLRLASRHRPRPAARNVGDTEAFETLERFSAGGTRPQTTASRSEGNIANSIEVRKQALVLKHESDRPLGWRQPDSVGSILHCFAGHVHSRVGQRREAGNRFESGRLARTVRTDQRNRFTRTDDDLYVETKTGLRHLDAGIQTHVVTGNQWSRNETRTTSDTASKTTLTATADAGLS